MLCAFSHLVLLIEQRSALIHLLRVVHIDIAFHEYVTRSEPEAAHSEVGQELRTGLHELGFAV